VKKKSNPMIARWYALSFSMSVGTLRRTLGAFAIVVATLIMPAPAFSEVPISIIDCGKITKPGLYQLDNNLFASSPSAGDCLIIQAANVSLNLNNYNLYGTTSAVGIHVMKSAARVFIEGSGSTIQSFGVGIQFDAAAPFADNFTVLSNSDAGILLNRVQQANLSNFSAVDNKNDGVRIDHGGNNLLQMPTISGSGRYGVWIQNSSRNSIGNFDVRNNVLAGIYVGCSQTGPRGSCARGGKPSNSNYLFSGTAAISSSGIQQYGIAIDEGNNFNRVVNIWAWQNNQLDLFDVNQNCGKNYWFAESTIGQVAPAACIN
jgi:Periplasmic copper-binding protein (NosD)